MPTLNPLLQDIAQRLVTADKSNLMSVANRFDETHEHIPQFYIFNSLVGAMAELVVRETLEEICKDFQGRVVFDPIKQGAATKTYNFVRHARAAHPGNLVVYRKPMPHQSTGNTYSEIDQLLLIDGLPVLFEIKFSKYFTRLSSNNIRDNVSYALDSKRIEYLLEPLREYFTRDDLGYVLILPKDKVDEKYNARVGFTQDDALIVPFYEGVVAFRKEVGRIAKLYCFLEDTRRTSSRGPLSVAADLNLIRPWRN